ncbi:hypothetical protein L195_g004688 [Trifolium pratense]|uniref:Uncharacterized protein n=1 Tax=Trifolium pratense TaxID=57577 RepID=A0A2K3NYQ6_TRIPR|nr:hypothetical protein L195_g004688 [Trifolium pratense]
MKDAIIDILGEYKELACFRGELKEQHLGRTGKEQRLSETVKLPRGKASTAEPPVNNTCKWAEATSVTGVSLPELLNTDHRTGISFHSLHGVTVMLKNQTVSWVKQK